MATIQTLNDWETGWIVRWKINDNFTAVNSDLSTLDTNKLEASDIATINGNTISAGGNLSIPTLIDWDKGDITLSSSGTVWTIDNDVVTFAKMQNITWDRILGRISGTSGDVGEITGTQLNTILPVATTSLNGIMSATDKTAFDAMDKWVLLKNDSFTAWGTYDSGTLTTYDIYKIELKWTHTWLPTINMRINWITTWASYNYMTRSTNWSSSWSTSQNQIQVYNSALWGGYNFRWTYEVDSATNSFYWNWSWPFNVSSNSTFLQNAHVATTTLTSIQLSTITNISGTIKIYWRNY